MANLWCEIAADYTEGVYGCGFHQPLGPEGFPSEETQRATVRRYLSAGGEEPSEQEIERWRSGVACRPMSLTVWQDAGSPLGDSKPPLLGAVGAAAGDVSFAPGVSDMLWVS